MAINVEETFKVTGIKLRTDVSEKSIILKQKFHL
jgi:hypothetical protein